MTGEQSLVQKNVLTNNGKQETTVFKIKAGAALPAEELSHVKSSSKPMRISDPSDEVKPEYSSPEKKSGQSKPRSAPAEEGKAGSSSSGLKMGCGFFQH